MTTKCDICSGTTLRTYQRQDAWTHELIQVCTACIEEEEDREIAEAMGEVVSPYSEFNPDNALNTDYSL